MELKLMQIFLEKMDGYDYQTKQKKWLKIQNILFKMEILKILF